MNVKVAKELAGVCVMAIDYSAAPRKGPAALAALIQRHDERAASFARGRKPSERSFAKTFVPGEIRRGVEQAFNWTFSEKYAND